MNAFLASLSQTTAPEDLSTGDVSSERQLGLEADKALDLARQHMNHEREDKPEDEDDPAEETEEEILAKALAEASIENLHEPETIPGNDSRIGDRHDERDDGGERDSDVADPFTFPSLPTHVPKDDEELEDEETKKKMDILLGLSGPSVKPSNPILPSAPKRDVGQGWNLPGFQDERDNDLDSWCCA